MSTFFRPVIGVVAPDPKGAAAPAANCDQCAYFQPSFESSAQGRCVHSWSDYVDDLVFSTHLCILLTTDYDSTLDSSIEPIVPVRR